MISRRVFNKLMLISPVASLSVSRTSAQNRFTTTALSAAYREIGIFDVSYLNYILEQKASAFGQIRIAYPPAKYPVRLYKIEYPSFVPVQNNRPVRLSGLLAIPDANIKNIPIISYQHGTTFARDDVPSNPKNSFETELMIALFASQGYALVAADYIGKGISTDLRDYLVKESQQQTTADLIVSSESIIQELGLTPSRLFLAGWSQGGNVTMALLQKLEANGRTVRAAATAAAPADLWIAMGAPLFNPRTLDAKWLSLSYAVIAHSYEYYYSMPGLAKSFLKPEFYQLTKELYYQKELDLIKLIVPLESFIDDRYFNPKYFSESAFGQLLQKSVSYRSLFQTPLRNYYGMLDEAVRPTLGELPMNYQKALGNGKVEGINLGDYDHRGTYLRAAAEWKTWFDSLF